ncbi:phage tail sheath C-terminal domain-containing protein [Pseudorhodoferax sp. Leaf267]|uniref:phage tail sheath family protein n=1 Tax=Pseudorhodoferax sp. Leaf267 TaxID=1736316 RepID=UPI0006F5E57C|nr:phage tail sheath C-terminal domain-containing protein [Pseudorhodoferax sp. Leaf267]KQP12283.1 phage tail protein [Pseudorhodoferax sp. Leaf267]
MPSALSYPGVYVEEVPSGVRTLTGVATSITAFVGSATAGPTHEAVMLTSYADYERRFGGLALASPMSYAVRDFYLNGGALALVVRVAAGDAAAATVTLPGADDLVLTAASVGAWGGRLSAAVDHDTDLALGAGNTDDTRYNLRLRYQPRAGRDEFVFETLSSVSTVATDPRYLPLVLERESSLARALDDVPAARPTSTVDADGTVNWVAGAGGSDGAALANTDLLGNAAARTGMHALAGADLFNLLVIPPLVRDVTTLPSTYTVVPADVWQAALAMCVERRAMLIVDPDPAWASPIADALDNARNGRLDLNLSGPAARNAALYFPALRMIDPLRDSRVDTFMPSGVVAGIIARTDVARGVWKAPAGLDASLNGVQDLQINLNDLQNGQLNPLGINCLRSMGVNGRVVWGARTLRGADASADEYKYLPVRRLALFLEESLYRGTQWAVFEPNDEPLWAQVRLNVGAFMQGLFRQGAFQGASARDAYFVKCDSQTTTQADINLGVLNVIVGFAPLKPAEFVVIKVQQMAGQIPV